MRPPYPLAILLVGIVSCWWYNKGTQIYTDTDSTDDVFRIYFVVSMVWLVCLLKSVGSYLYCNRSVITDEGQ
jgi:hypothetical protein